MFYQSSSPLQAEPLYKGWSPTSIGPVTVHGWTSQSGSRPDSDSRSLRPNNEPSSATAQVKAIGGVSDGWGQLGLHFRTVMPDSSSLRAFPFVDIFSEQMLLRRGQAWRTLRHEQDSLYEERFVPLSVSDVQRLIQSDTVSIAINQAHFRLPPAVQEELTSLYAAAPDSLPMDTTEVENRLTVFHSPNAPPQFERGVKGISNVVSYPSAAKERGIEGTVRVGFVVHPDGTTSHAQIEQAAHPLLNAVAIRVAQSGEYKPSSLHGRPIPVWMSLPIVFQWQ